MLFYKLPKLIRENTEIGYDDGSLEQTSGGTGDGKQMNLRGISRIQPMCDDRG